jgi:hypothetical protein
VLDKAHHRDLDDRLIQLHAALVCSADHDELKQKIFSVIVSVRHDPDHGAATHLQTQVLLRENCLETWRIERRLYTAFFACTCCDKFVMENLLAAFEAMAQVWCDASAVLKHYAQLHDAIGHYLDLRGRGDELVIATPQAGHGHRRKGELELIPGGFAFRGKVHELSGRKLAMLRCLVASRYWRCTRNDLREAMGVDDVNVDYPEQVVADTAKGLRAVLRKVARDAGLSCEDPLASIGKGDDLTYALKFP